MRRLFDKYPFTTGALFGLIIAIILTLVIDLIKRG